MSDGPQVTVEALPPHLAPGTGNGAHRLPALEEGELPPFGEARERLVADFERAYLGELLQRTKGNLSEAARRSGVDRTNLRRLLKAHGLRVGA